MNLKSGIALISTVAVAIAACIPVARSAPSAKAYVYAGVAAQLTSSGEQGETEYMLSREEIVINVSKSAIGSGHTFEVFNGKCANPQFSLCIDTGYLAAELPKDDYAERASWTSGKHSFEVLDRRRSDTYDEFVSVVGVRSTLDNQPTDSYVWSPCRGLIGITRYIRQKDATFAATASLIDEIGYGATRSCKRTKLTG